MKVNLNKSKWGVVAFCAAALCVLFTAPLLNTPQRQTLAPIAKVEHPPIEEMSGIVQSIRYPGVFWVHNDSGDDARIFAIHADGKIVMPNEKRDEFYADKTIEGKSPYPGIKINRAENADWEDIALDDDTIYIADTGNNDNARRDLGVYALTEPNPNEADSARILKWIPIAYPDQTEFPGEKWEFDCESLFVYRHNLYFITKHRKGGASTPGEHATLYRLDKPHTDRVNTLKKISEPVFLGGWATGADLSPDGKTLAVLTQAPLASVWLFERPKDSDNFFAGKARRLILEGAKQCEAICWETPTTLLVTNEQRDIFRVKTSEISPAP